MITQDFEIDGDRDKARDVVILVLSLPELTPEGP